MNVWKLIILHGDPAPGYHCDNILITKGCIGRRIGIPQRIRVTTWNQKHMNYKKCVKSERVGMTLTTASGGSFVSVILNRKGAISTVLSRDY